MGSLCVCQIVIHIVLNERLLLLSERLLLVPLWQTTLWIIQHIDRLIFSHTKSLLCALDSHPTKNFFSFLPPYSKKGERVYPVGEIFISLSPSLEVPLVPFAPPFKINDLGEGRGKGQARARCPSCPYLSFLVNQ
jgi:hypothetical protein